MLQRQPQNFDALHFLGFIAFQTGKSAEAVKLFGAALAINPKDAMAQNNTSAALVNLGRYDAAVESADAAIALRADFAGAYNNRGNAFMGLKQFQRAIESYDRALASNPKLADALSNRGSALAELGDNAAALQSYDRAIALKPDLAKAYGGRAIVLDRLGQWGAALMSWERAVAFEPRVAEYHCGRGGTLRGRKNYDAALQSYDRAIALQPNLADAHYNRGLVLFDMGRPEAALQSYDKAVALQPDFAAAYNNRGIVLSELGHHQAAVESYERAISVRPDYTDAHTNLGMAYLRLGDFDKGWEHYERRLKNPELGRLVRDFAQPQWTGREPLAGKTILLHNEQGLGDALHFSRYAKMVSNLGARVILEVPASLTTSLANLEGVADVVARGEPLPAIDFHSPLLSLPWAFKTTAQRIPTIARYVTADPEKVSEWRRRLGEKTRPRIGLTWSGNAAQKNDHNRSIPFLHFAELLPEGFDYVSLQKDVRDQDREALNARADIMQFGDDLKDFSDTAALCELMDLVVTVCTSTAHLAGAMGKPVWVLLSFNPCWRWLTDRSDSPWYPSAKLYRQARPGEWKSVFAEVKADLARGDWRR